MILWFYDFMISWYITWGRSRPMLRSMMRAARTVSPGVDALTQTLWENKKNLINLILEQEEEEGSSSIWSIYNKTVQTIYKLSIN